MKKINKNKILSLMLVSSYTFGAHAQGDIIHTKPECVSQEMFDNIAENTSITTENLNLKENQNIVEKNNNDDKTKNCISIGTSLLNLTGRIVSAYGLIKAVEYIACGFSNLGDSITETASNKSTKNVSEFQAISPDKIYVSLKDIGGYDDVKNEFLVSIDRLKNHENYNKAGINSTMQGVVLYGPPGTGKTMFAKAVAKEADVPFFNVSGSEFVKIYVGNGAARIRQLFDEVKKHEKCVVFIDEIDAVGGKRDGSSNNSERDQTLNQLLTCLTDLNSRGKGSVLVIAATNRLDMLDDALIRSGRFDQKIKIGLPDKKARESIIEKYKSQYQVFNGIDVNELVGNTDECSGADIDTLFRTCAVKFIYSKNKNENIDIKKLIKEELKKIKKTESSEKNCSYQYMYA